MCPHMRRSLTLVPDIALYLASRGPWRQQNQHFTFIFIFCIGASSRVLNHTSDSDSEVGSARLSPGRYSS